MISIRPAQPASLDDWSHLRYELWPEEPAEELRQEAEAFFAGRSKYLKSVLLAHDASGKLAGFAELNIRPYAEGCVTDRVAFLEGWYVSAAYRKQGVGKALVAAAEEWARKNGCTEFASDTQEANASSTAAHLALGFEEVEVIRCFRKRLDQIKKASPQTDHRR